RASPEAAAFHRRRVRDRFQEAGQERLFKGCDRLCGGSGRGGRGLREPALSSYRDGGGADRPAGPGGLSDREHPGFAEKDFTSRRAGCRVRLAGDRSTVALRKIRTCRTILLKI